MNGLQGFYEFIRRRVRRSQRVSYGRGSFDEYDEPRSSRYSVGPVIVDVLRQRNYDEKGNK